MNGISGNYKFLASHEWAKLEEDGRIIIGQGEAIV